MKTFLIIGGGIEAVPGIRKAKDMGLYTIVSDRDPNAPGFALADDTLLASTYDVEETVQKASDYNSTVRPLDGTICIATDVPHTVAAVANAVGLPGISLESARLATDKLAMKEKFQADGVAVPWFRSIGSAKDLHNAIQERGYPLVIKPVDSRGSRGVLKLTKEAETDWAYDYAMGFSPSARVIVEDFLSGPQVSTESIVLEGVIYTPGFSDRNYEFMETYAPHIIENGGDLPSHLSEAERSAVNDLVSKATRSMGIGTGVVKGDVVVSEGKPYIIEIAPRLSGGYFCSHEIPLSTGVDFLAQAIKLSLGDRVNPEDLEPKFQRYISQRYIFPPIGRVQSIIGFKEVSAREEIDLCEIRIQNGDTMGPIDNHPARAGVIIAHGDSRDGAIAAATSAVQGIRIAINQNGQSGTNPTH